MLGEDSGQINVYTPILVNALELDMQNTDHSNTKSSQTNRLRPRKVCILGASGKLGRYMIRHALDRGYEVVGVCRPQSVHKLADYADRMEIIPGATDDREVVKRAVAGCDGVLTVLVPWGMQRYASGTAQAVLDYAPTNARLIFSCGWHIRHGGQDRYQWYFLALVAIAAWIARLFRVVDIDDQVEATRRIFASSRAWTVVRGSDLEEGPSEGLPVWSPNVGDPVLASNRTRRIDFALFMVNALTDDSLIQQAPAIVGCTTSSALEYGKSGTRVASPTASRTPAG